MFVCLCVSRLFDVCQHMSATFAQVTNIARRNTDPREIEVSTEAVAQVWVGKRNCYLLVQRPNTRKNVLGLGIC